MSQSVQLTINIDKSGVQDRLAELYHKGNPYIYEKFKELTFKTIEKGFKNYGAKSIFELIRWHSGVSANGDEFKINNNYTSFYARMFAKEFPQHKDFFRIRKSKFD